MNKGVLIRLLDDVVVSATAATAATPASLPFIPGAMILGAVAAQAAKDGLDMSGPEAFALFHSGKFRFLDGLPVTPDGRLTFPLPLSIHRRKGSQERPCSGSKDIHDFAIEALETGFEQLRDDACCANGEEHVVKRTSTLRTAIDPATGQADDGQLFGYEALKQGQFFWAGFDSDDDEIDRVLTWLAGENSRIHLFGRSRASEYGRVEISRCEAWSIPEMSCEPGERYIWFLSDFMPLDENGLPTRRPTFSTLQATAKTDWSRSFHRERRFAPFNAAWQKRAPERVLITRGSVFVVSDCDLALGLASFGAGQELGYGMAIVSDRPPEETLKSIEQPIVSPPVAQTAAGKSENSLMVPWLQDRAASVDRRTDQDGKASEIAKLLLGHYESAHRLAGRQAGPGPSQWGRVSQGLLHGQSIENVTDTEPWNARFKAGDNATFREFVAELDPRVISLVAKKMRPLLEKHGWNDGT